VDWHVLAGLVPRSALPGLGSSYVHPPPLSGTPSDTTLYGRRATHLPSLHSKKSTHRLVPDTSDIGVEYLICSTIRLRAVFCRHPASNLGCCVWGAGNWLAATACHCITIRYNPQGYRILSRQSGRPTMRLYRLAMLQHATGNDLVHAHVICFARGTSRAVAMGRMCWTRRSAGSVPDPGVRGAVAGGWQPNHCGTSGTWRCADQLREFPSGLQIYPDPFDIFASIPKAAAPFRGYVGRLP
jgi:hypothetical protein